VRRLRRYPMTSAAIHYITQNEWFYLEPSVSVMARHEWVHKIVVLHTDRARPRYFGRLSRAHAKVEEHWRAFGSGWDKQPEAGGFDEIAARNLAVTLAAGAGARWVVKCDSDEYYTAAFGGELAVAESESRPAVDANWNQLLEPDAIRHEPVMARQIVAWRADSGIRYRLCVRHGLRNRTMHCHPDIETGWYSANGYFYFHVRHMIGPKIRLGKDVPRQPIPNSLVPTRYARIYERAKQPRPPDRVRPRGLRPGRFKVLLPVTSR
jgi:hypothetical protein